MRRKMIERITRINYAAVERYLSSFLRQELEGSGKSLYVLGLSGGVDSAAALALAVKSVGRERVLPVIMPDASVTPKEDVEDAESLARLFGVKYHVINISPIVEAIEGSLPIHEEGDRVAIGNVRARLRMLILYYYANKLNALVLGCSDRSELLIGYFTKYGDAAADVAPLAVLYKSQVRELAIRLGVPEKIARKPSSPRLWAGQMAEEELGMSYEEIDVVLHLHFDRGMEPRQIATLAGVPMEKIERILEMHRRSSHKRGGVKMPELAPVLMSYES